MEAQWDPFFGMGAPSRSSPEPDCAPSVVEACLCQEAVMITVRLQCLVLRRYGVEDANWSQYTGVLRHFRKRHFRRRNLENDL